MGTAENVNAWSTTAASNSGADSTIGTLANTSNPTAIDDWIRSLMASIAKYADDTGGALVAGGTATALTVTTGQGLSSGHIANGLALKVRTASAATGAATITVDALTAVDIKKQGSAAIEAGDWASGDILDLVYSSTATAFIAANLNKAYGGYVLLETGSFTAAANKDIGLDSYPGYSSYRLVIHHIRPVTDSVELRMRVSTDGGGTFLSTSTYDSMGTGYYSGGNLPTLLSDGDSWQLTNSVGNATEEGAAGHVDIFLAGTTTFRPLLQSAFTFILPTGEVAITNTALTNNSAMDVTDLRLLFSSGNIAAVGSYSLFGVR